MAVTDATIRQQAFMAAITGLCASGDVLDVSLVFNEAGQATASRLEGADMLTRIARTIADRAVVAWKAT
jgi:hypothetical protein